MTLKHAARLLAERLTGSRIYRVEHLPRGVDLALDLARFLPGFRPEVVFDVGANLGQSAAQYLQWFPGASLYCFEPVRATFEQLHARMAGHRGVHCLHLALGAAPGTARMVVEGQPGLDDRSHLAAATDPLDSSGAPRTDREDVKVETLDGFCSAQGIGRIGFLKIDTEGGDLDVLRGAAAMLSSRSIDLVEVEAGMNPGNTRHVPFERLKEFLESTGYLLFAIYEQIHEWPTDQPQLRRTNAVFLSQRMIDGFQPPAAGAPIRPRPRQ